MTPFVSLTERDEALSILGNVADDVVNVRIYQGIHFRAADELARKQGTAAADWAFAKFLRLYQ